jgi:N6-L-threonylcarbamoyladenine synthase
MELGIDPLKQLFKAANSFMIWLGIETSCDETAVALVRRSGSVTEVLGGLISSQVTQHQPFGGVVPELAVREHLRQLPALTARLLSETGVGVRQIDGLAVTEGPGLAACLLIGYCYARGLALALDKPVMGVNHLEGHLLSPALQSEPLPFPFIGLIVSGGHTLLVTAEDWGRYRRLGGTVDDAAGEVFDKVARLLGLGYPGGPEIEKLARLGNANAYDFPRSFLERDNYNFSFSGLKTAVRYFWEKQTAADRENPQLLADICASFQEAVVQILVRKTILAAQSARVSTISAAGGVVCNGRLREVLSEEAQRAGLKLALAPMTLCTDNAVMIAAVAAAKHNGGLPVRINADINPNLPLGVFAEVPKQS